jgi:hypothetical protein
MLDRGSRILLSGTISVAAYLLTMYILLQSPVVAVFSGSEGETATNVFTVRKNNWDISITYFRVLSPFWDLRIEVYSEGEKDKQVFSASAVRYVGPGNQESAELNSHPSLPPGSYYLKVYSESVQWTIQVTEWG